MLAWAAALLIAGDPVTHANFDEGVGVRTANGRWALNVGVVARVQSDLLIAGGDVERFDGQLRMFRPRLIGKLGTKWLKYFVQPEVAGPRPALLDAEVRIEPDPRIGVRLGQQVVPFSRAFITPLPHAQFVEFSPADVAFRRGRGLGGTVRGALGDGHFEYFAGAVTGNVLNPIGQHDDDLTYVARFAVNPGEPVPYDSTAGRKGDLPLRGALGLGGYTRPAADMPGRQWVAGADAIVQWWRFQTLIEAFVADRGDEAPVGWGAYGQVSGFAVAKTVEPGVRVTVMNETSRRDDLLVQVDSALHLYAKSDHLKVWINYAFVERFGMLAGRRHRVLAQFQLFF